MTFKILKNKRSNAVNFKIIHAAAWYCVIKSKRKNRHDKVQLVELSVYAQAFGVRLGLSSTCSTKTDNLKIILQLDKFI